VAQSIKHLTLDFGSGHDLRVMRSSPSWVLSWAWSLLKILSFPDAEKGEPSYTVGGNASWCSGSGKQYGGSSKS